MKRNRQILEVLAILLVIGMCIPPSQSVAASAEPTRYDLSIQVVDQNGNPINGVAIQPMWSWACFWAEVIGPVTWTSRDGFGNEGMAGVTIWDRSPEPKLGFLATYYPHPWCSICYYVNLTAEEIRSGEKITLRMDLTFCY